jgi:5-methylcytosine-specific restriction endonuclease McrA
MKISYYQSLSAEQRKAHNSKHYAKERQRKLNRVCCCAECGQEYLRKDGHSHKFCKKQCKNTFSFRAGNARRRSMVSAAKVNGIGFHEVYEKSNGHCQSCHIACPLELRGSFDPKAPEVDHILPVALSGAHIRANLQILCRQCNIAKGARLSMSEVNALSHLSVDAVDLAAINAQNINKPQANSSSGYKGVTWDKINKKWTARFYDKNGKRLFVGSFASAELAGHAATQKRMEIYA